MIQSGYYFLLINNKSLLFLSLIINKIILMSFERTSNFSVRLSLGLTVLQHLLAFFHPCLFLEKAGPYRV